MSSIFWDAMLFVYLLENHPEFVAPVRKCLRRSYERGDRLLTSYLAVGEVAAGAKRNPGEVGPVLSVVSEMGFTFIPFDGACAATFAKLRSDTRLKVADSIHLACAAAAGVDMYLTGDGQLLKRGLHVPGIQFIADFTLPIL